jgi:hypothetical protein
MCKVPWKKDRLYVAVLQKKNTKHTRVSVLKIYEINENMNTYKIIKIN